MGILIVMFIAIAFIFFTCMFIGAAAGAVQIAKDAAEAQKRQLAELQHRNEEQ